MPCLALPWLAVPRPGILAWMPRRAAIHFGLSACHRLSPLGRSTLATMFLQLRAFRRKTQKRRVIHSLVDGLGAMRPETDGAFGRALICDAGRARQRRRCSRSGIASIEPAIVRGGPAKPDYTLHTSRQCGGPATKPDHNLHTSSRSVIQSNRVSRRRLSQAPRRACSGRPAGMTWRSRGGPLPRRESGAASFFDRSSWISFVTFLVFYLFGWRPDQAGAEAHRA
jgi:hypothetical protein